MSQGQGKPSVLSNIVRFQREHNKYANQQPRGKLYHGAGVQSLGFLRGSNMAAGYKIHVQTSNGKKVWDGTISQGVDDDFSGPPNNEGPAWLFAVTCTTYTPDPDDTDEIQVTVTVTNPGTGQSSDPTVADPNPEDVP